MPLPILAALAGAVVGRTTKKEAKKQPVSGYTKKNKTKVKAYTRKAR